MKANISIIIPAFNEEKYLPKLLHSIAKQTLLPKEVIVADAFSNDKTRDIAKKFGCKVVDGGLPGKARNEGAGASTQPLILFLDADVILPPRFLEKAIKEFMDRNLDIAACYASALSPLKRDEMIHALANSYIKVTNSFYPHMGGFCVFVKKTVHDRIHGFDESLVLGEDHDYIRRAKHAGKVNFAYLKSYKIPLSVRRQTEEGRLYFTLKYIAIEFHLIFIGKIKKNYFNYKFGSHGKNIRSM